MAALLLSAFLQEPSSFGSQSYLCTTIISFFLIFFSCFKLGEVPEAPHVAIASSDDDKSMSSEESEIESDEEEREKR